MGLKDFWKKGKAIDSTVSHNAASMVDEYVWLVTTIAEKNQRDEHFIERVYLFFAGTSDVYGSDALLLNGPSPFRTFGIDLAEKEIRDLGSKVSAQYFGLRLLSLWLRSQQEDSDDARQIFMELCGFMFTARKAYYAGLPDKNRFIIKQTSTVGLQERVNRPGNRGGWLV